MLVELFVMLILFYRLIFELDSDYDIVDIYICQNVGKDKILFGLLKMYILR